jgi:hypothetical protein
VSKLEALHEIMRDPHGVAFRAEEIKQAGMASVKA